MSHPSFVFLARLLLVALMSSFSYSVIAADHKASYQKAKRLIGNGDLVTGMKLLREAAEAGHAPAQADLGEILDRAEEDKEAVVWYRKAAEQGNAAGQFGLGMAYASGEGIARDVKHAEEWVRKAAEQDYANALDVMVQAYKKGGLGLVPDPVQAEVWRQRGEKMKQGKSSETEHAKKK